MLCYTFRLLYKPLKLSGQLAVVAESRYFILPAKFANTFHIIYKSVFLHLADL